MTDYPVPFDQIIPQAGAILHLDTDLLYDRDSVRHGDKHWVLDGSCVLVDSNRVLAVRHALDKTREAAVFFPFEGIFWLGDERVEDYAYGDTLCLCSMESKLAHTPPVRYAYVSRKTFNTALLTGYGRWSNQRGWERDGIQRSVEVKLHLPGSRGSTRYGDNLDITWWSDWNQRLGAGRNNSGGPMLRFQDRTLLGLSREASQGQQAASRITRDREEWLRENEVGVSPFVADAFANRSSHHLTIETKGGYKRIRVPKDSTKVQVTLSATPGLRLQMDIDFLGQKKPFLKKLMASDKQSGRFLCRSKEIPRGKDVLWIGVAPVSTAPVRAAQVQAQLCCMFT